MLTGIPEAASPPGLGHGPRGVVTTAPGIAARELWASAVVSPLCVFPFSSVISMRCMVQFVGREAKYRWVMLLRMGRRALSLLRVCQDRPDWDQLSPPPHLCPVSDSFRGVG